VVLWFPLIYIFCDLERIVSEIIFGNVSEIIFVGFF
jgi:hypothetical protein